MLELVTGAEIISRAAIDAGCNFFAGYPITPATGILISMSKLLPQVKGISVQCEDEIASIGYCLGASSAGLKVMTATSGPGMSLYSENIGFAQMAELPLVIVNVQRMGPATGGATTNAEGDVQFMRWITSGGYPMIVLAPTTVGECYPLTIEAFNIAEKFRVPVILSTSKELITTRDTVEIENYKKPEIIQRKKADKNKNYLPYLYENLEDVPDFAAIGGDILTRVNTSTHDKAGIITKDPEKAGQALLHLNEKIEANKSELEIVQADIDEKADTIIIAYGMMGRIAKEVVRKVRAQNKRISLLTIYSIWPVPEQALNEYVEHHKRIIVPELNLGQYVLEISRLFSEKEIISITRIDGKLISPDAIIEYVIPA